jgi:hypothetical protein
MSVRTESVPLKTEDRLSAHSYPDDAFPARIFLQPTAPPSSAAWPSSWRACTVLTHPVQYLQGQPGVKVGQ